MNCTNNPNGFQSYNQSNATYPAGTANTGNYNLIPQTGYMATDQWGGNVVVNPNDPTSPLSVQPDGRGTPLVAEGSTNMVQPAADVNSQIPETLTQHIYTPGYLNSYVGRLMRVEFLVGNQTTDRVGYLREVGASYIVLESVDYGNLMMCDLYSIKFATILSHTIDANIASLYEDQ